MTSGLIRRVWAGRGVAKVLLAMGLASSLVVAGMRPFRVHADSAPVWESPSGLAPGDPRTRVQMRSETVDIHIVERGMDAFALVSADFSLVNVGEPVAMKVGFPNWTHTVLADVYGFETTPFSPGIFSPRTLSSFRARAGEGEYQPAIQQLKTNASDNFGSDWYVWDMSFPANSTTLLQVSYEQKLTFDIPDPPPFVQPMYVLRTGALWNGVIGEGTVRMTVDSGGVLLGGPEVFTAIGDDGITHTLPESGAYWGINDAAERSELQPVWRFRDLEPKADIGATYVFRDVWNTLRDGERDVQAGTADGVTYERLTRTALKLLGDSGPHLVPMAVLNRFPPERVRGWARQAVMMSPDRETAWEALGDIEHWFGLPTRKHHGWLECYPTRAADAYRTAADLGSWAASEKLTQLELLREDQVANGQKLPQPCPDS